MHSADDPDPVSPSPGAADREIIELTDVVEEPAGAVIQVSAGEPEGGGLESGKPGEPSLEEILAPLQDAPQDLDFTLPDLDAPGPAAGSRIGAPFQAELRRQVQAALRDDQFRRIVREVVEEVAARLAREMFPQVALEAINREIAALKKKLAEES